MPAVVEGYQDLMRALKHADRDVRLGVRKELREIAKPVKATAETLAVERIRSIGPVWSRMRVGVTQKSVYVAPRQRGKKTGPQKRGQQFANLLADRAMDPTRERHAHQFEHEMEQMLDRVADKFNRGI